MREVWLSPHGNDGAAGTSASSPWRTLQCAAKWLASTSAASRPATIVHLLPGTYHLDETLTLGPKPTVLDLHNCVVSATALCAALDAATTAGHPLRALALRKCHSVSAAVLPMVLMHAPLL